MSQFAKLGTRQPSGGKEMSLNPVTGYIKRAGQELCDALRGLAVQIPAKSRSPQEFARILKVHRTLASRLLNAIRTDDPLAAISRMPRSEGLRIILQAAKTAVTREAHQRAEEALAKFEQVVNNELGGWDGFDAVVTEWLPEARERFELANKQLSFKGMANLMGVRTDVQLDTIIYYPDVTGRRCDIALLEGMVNLRRLRPSVRIPVASFTPNIMAPKLLDGAREDISADATDRHNPLLRQFCSVPDPQLEEVQIGEMTNFILAGNEIGTNSAMDIFTANVIRGGRPLTRAPAEEPVRPHLSGGVILPSKLLLMNVLLHEDVWPGDPQLLIYDMHVHGVAAPLDPSRDFDRLDMMEGLQALGKGAARFRASEVGRHVEMVQFICDKMGWDSERLRGYRLRVQYPLLHTQYCILFDPLPVRAD